MKPTLLIALVIVAGAALLVSAFVVRDGLVTLAAAVRDKPLPSMPDQLTVTDLTIEHATVQHAGRTAGEAGGSGGVEPIRLTIENMRIDAPPGALVE